MPALCLRCNRIENDVTSYVCTRCGQTLTLLQNQEKIPRPHMGESACEPPLTRSNVTPFLTAVLPIVYFLSCITYVAGVILPLVAIKKEVIKFGITFISEGNTFSLLSATWGLLRDGHLFLFLIVFIFSLLFPSLKLFVLYKLYFDSGSQKESERQIKWLSVTGKWSMLDVFVVGLMVVALKLGDLVEVKVHVGMYMFAVSVLLTMLLTLFAPKTAHHVDALSQSKHE